MRAVIIRGSVINTRPLLRSPFRSLCKSSHSIISHQDSTLVKPNDCATRMGFCYEHAIVIPDAVSEAQEDAFIRELEPIFNRRRFQRDHWDNVIIGYREVERNEWVSPICSGAVKQIREAIESLLWNRGCFGVVDIPTWLPVHAIDLAPNGYILPHVDSVKFSGKIVAGLSLLSTAVMHLKHEHQSNAKVELLLPRRSLYVLSKTARYDFTHSISDIDGDGTQRSRRISLIFRDAHPDDIAARGDRRQRA